MKIYIVFPGALFPIVGMSQVRMLNQLISLNKDHQIVFSDFISTPKSLRLAEEKLCKLDIAYKPVFTFRYNRSKAYRVFRHIARIFLYHILTVSREELALGDVNMRKQVIDIAKSENIHGFIMHYWFLGNYFKYLDSNILRMIDTHNVVEERIEVLDNYSTGSYLKWKFGKVLAYSLKKQRSYFQNSDLVIVNSEKQKELIHNWNANIPVNVTFNGQDLDQYLNYLPELPAEHAICFYGALSNQFNRKALKRIISNIYPAMKAKIPELRLYVIGSSPPSDILGSIKDHSIIVTGFVDDIRAYLTKCKLMLLPLDTAAGFRGRSVEVMALGIPIVGTHNALQSVGFINGKLGFIEETDEKITLRAVELLQDTDLLKEMSTNCREYARKNFSLAATFGKLSQDISLMKKRNEHAQGL